MMVNIAKGTKFGKLTVIEDLGMVLQKSGKKRHFVKCLCDCGAIKDINWYDLKDGKIRSCGCFFKKMISDLGKKVTKERNGNPKHNLCHTDLYRKYYQIKEECYNKNNIKYENFGGRGIKICNDWMKFENFYKWAIENGYSEQRKSICRKDLDGDFSPENCFFESPEYLRKHCQSTQSSEKRNKKAGQWRMKNKDILLKSIGKAMKTRLERYGTLVTNNREKCSWKAGWREIGGKRKYFRSKWEANYARYLEWLKEHNQIKEWQHENKTFWFDGIKRGCRSYLPDFEITNNNGTIEYHEVKGWYDDRSKTKTKRMAKYYPEVKLIIIFQKQYNDIKNKVGMLIKDWE